MRKDSFGYGSKWAGKGSANEALSTASWKSSQFKNSFSIGLVSGTGRVAKGWSDWYWNLFYGYACMIPPECDALFMLALQAGGLD
jgi:hypothetical protein